MSEASQGGHRYRVTLRLWVLLSVTMALVATLSTLSVLHLQRPLLMSAGRLPPNFERVIFATVAIAGGFAALGGLVLGVVLSRRIWAIVDRAEAARMLVFGDGESTGRAVRDELVALDVAVGRLTLSMDKFISDSDILARLPTAMLLIDANGRLLSWNATAEELLGSDLAVFRGAPLLGDGGPFFGAAGAGAVTPLLREAQRGQDVVQADDVRATLRSGKRLVFDVTVQRRRGRAHEGEIFVVLLRDASEKRRIREEIKRADQLALLGGMAAQVAHEVRTPLAAVRGLVELLQADLPPGERHQQYTDRMIEALNRQERLVRKLLTFTHPEPDAWEPVDIPDLLERLLVSWPGRKPEVEIGKPVPLVQGDPLLLGEVLTNLIQNALEASPDDKVIAGVYGDRSTVRISVTNHGVGIPPELQQRIFQPFFTTKPRGTGLGLAIARQVVEAHHGTIQVGSDGRTVTQFLVELPAYQPAETVAASA